MKSVYRLVSTVNQFYREINPSTLSGAIDVVVVQQPNGELACSPFHVRFGKLSVLRPQEKKVEVTVNNEIVDFPMKIGEAGEAFFIFETENVVPEEFQTSPLAGPSDPLPNVGEPDFLDLGDSSEQTSPIPKDSDPIGTPKHSNILSSDFSTEDGYEGDIEPKVFGIVEDSKIFIGSTSEDVTIVEAIDGQNLLNDDVDEKYLITNDQDEKDANVEIHVQRQEEILKSDVMLAISEVETLSETPKQIDSTLIDDRHSVIEVESIEKKIDQLDEVHLNDSFSERETYTNLHLAQYDEIILPPIEERDVSKDLAIHLPSVHSNWENSEGPFSDTELDETRKPEKPLERRTHRDSPLSDTELEYEPTKPSKDGGEWSWGWGALPVRTSEKMEHWQEGTDDKERKDRENHSENSSGVEIDGRTHRFEMSLCGNDGFGMDENTEAEIFRKKLVSFEQFSENPQLLNDKSLVIRYNDRYYTWPTAAPLIASLIVFNKSLPETAVNTLSSNRLKDLRSPDQRESSLRSWSRWWSRSASSQHTNVNEIVEGEPKTDDKSEVISQDAKKPTKFYAKTLRLTSEQLKSLNLKKGVNTMSFSVPSSYQGKATCVAKLFFWDYDTQIVISDIDGTITKSDALGHVFTMIGRDWTHSGVAKLYSDIRRNGYQILYLTSRAIGQADYTRDYLEKVKQDKYQLPDGPVIMSPDRLLTAFHREVIMRKPEVFKMSCLRDIQKLFGDRNPFFAGFGNRITDALSYRSVNVPSSRIFTIDSNGEVKLELLSGYKSSYVDLSDLVDQMFPHIGSNKWDTVYNDWNYWKSDIPEIELPPEIYETKLSTALSPKLSPKVNGSQRLEVIRTFTGSIAGGNNEQKILLQGRTEELEGSISLSPKKSHDNSNNTDINGNYKDNVMSLSKRRTLYVGGDVDMPGRMNIHPERDEGGTIIGYDEEFEDEEEMIDNEHEDSLCSSEDQDDEYEDDDIPANIDLTKYPY